MTTENRNPLGSVNRDKTGLRYVRRGCTVRMGSYRGRVVRVRTGNAIVDWAGGGKGDCKPCSLLEVIAL
ncbi:hypothetical protein [Polaromonas sp.]|uniref:hypothetical protein n=1 Tax=Polaromonas sp. TaxID=1869339 RepID=UPI003CA09480